MPGADPVELVVPTRRRDVEGLPVGRVLPHGRRRMVGPFVFLDHLGPVELGPGEAVDVRPHPHIGLATVTYLFAGAIVHRDSLGSEQPITPGAVNWMTAGRGIVHSERSDAAERSTRRRLHGVQSWVALPEGAEEAAPSFLHVAADDIPTRVIDGGRVRVVAGTSQELASPVPVASPTLYLDVALDAGATFVVDDPAAERAVFPVSGRVRLGAGPELDSSGLAVLRPGAVRLEALEPARLLVIGGEPVGRRFIWWNFVSSSEARIDAARDDWEAGRFTPVPGDGERVAAPPR
jgi:redox-sensitive bicupin YhaK (pirin superfamily)